jgi:glycine cleavage system H protein
MAAGIVSYKLCDRDFDCERCPLDLALRGRPCAGQVERVVRPIAFVFPDDRRYGPGHLWARMTSAGRVRVGLDAFAAEVLAAAHDVELPADGDSLDTGDTVCTVEAHPGRVALKTPIPGRITYTNEALGHDPEAVISDPYEAGWIAELQPFEPAPESALARLLPAVEAKKRSKSDMDRFRRQVAMQLLVGTGEVGPAMADGGESLTDLRQMLGAERYLKIVCELLG